MADGPDIPAHLQVAGVGGVVEVAAQSLGNLVQVPGLFEEFRRPVLERIGAAGEVLPGLVDSLEDWVSAFLEETGDLNETPKRLRCYFDYAAYARDLELGGDVWTVRHEGETWVFWNR